MARKPNKLTPVGMSMSDKDTAVAINAAVDEMIRWLLAFGKERPIKQLVRTDLINLVFATTSVWVAVRSRQGELNDPIDDLFDEKSSSEMAHLLG